MGKELNTIIKFVCVSGDLGGVICFVPLQTPIE
jgi:hypothetical protein